MSAEATKHHEGHDQHDLHDGRDPHDQYGQHEGHDAFVSSREIQRKGWIVLFAMLFAGIIMIMNQYKVPVFMSALIGEFFPTSPGNAGWLMSVIAVAGIITAFPSAFLLNRFGPKRVGLVGIGFMVVGCAVGALTTTNPAQLIAGRLLEGVGVAMMGVVATTVISMYFPREKAGLPMGIWNLWYVVGATLAYNIGVPVSLAFSGDPSNWHVWWWFADVLALLSFVIFALFVSKPREGRERAAKRAGERTERPSIMEGFKVTRMWIFGLGFCFLMFTALSVLTWVPTYVMSIDIPRLIASGMDPHVAEINAGIRSGTMSSIGFAASIPMAIITAFCLQKWQKTKQRNLMAVAAAIMTLLYTFAFLVPYEVLPYYLVLLGLESGWTSGVVWSMVPITMPKRVTIPIGMGIIIFFQGISNLLATPVIGYIISTGTENVYNWSHAAPVALVTTIIGTILWIIYAAMKPPVYEEDQESV